MDTAKQIPVHDFSRDDETSVPFDIVPLKAKAAYDSSVPHRHNYYEIFLFEKGGGRHTIDFGQVPIESHSVHFVSPGQVHLVQRELDTYGTLVLFSREFYYLNLRDRNLLFEMPFLNNLADRPVLNLNEVEFHECLSIVRKMEVEYTANGTYMADMLRGYLNVLLILCKRLFEQQLPVRVNESAGSPLFTAFRSALEKHFTATHRVQAYASMLGVSEKHLTETVKALAGKTALEYIHDRILLEAQRLLIHSGCSNKEVAYMLHFEDPSHFSKFFKAKTGLAPNEYKAGFSKMYQ